MLRSRLERPLGGIGKFGGIGEFRYVTGCQHDGPEELPCLAQQW